MYPEIYDLRGQRLAILQDAYNIHLEFELNNFPVLHFCLPATSRKWQYVTNEMIVKYDREEYVIKQDEVQEGSPGEKVNTVECPSIATELNTKLVQVLGTRLGPPNFSPEIFHESGNPEYILNKILANTGWSVGVISESLQGKVRSFLSEWESGIFNLLEAAEKYEGYIKYRPGEREIDLLDEIEIGADRGVTIAYAKNMTSISRSRDTSELVTRLYLFGGVPAELGTSDQLEMTINQVGLGIEEALDPYYRPETERIYVEEEWVDCASFVDNFQHFLALGYSLEEIQTDIAEKGDSSRFVRVGHFKDDDYIDPIKLFEYGKGKLDNELSKPKTTYNVGLIDLSKLSGWEMEYFDLGDWVTVVNKDIGIDVKARIVKMTVYPGFPEKTTIELSDTKDTIGDVIAEAIQVSGAFKRKSGMHNILRNAISTAATVINNSIGTVEWKEGQLTLRDVELDAQGNMIFETIIENGEEKQVPILTGKLVRLTPGGIGVSKDAGQNFPYAITGEGILGDRLVISDVHVVSLGGGHTQIKPSGVTVYDLLELPAGKTFEELDPIEQAARVRVQLGQYGSGESLKYGLRIHSGSIEVTGGGLNDSHIGSISAGKIKGGTIVAEQSLYLGDASFELSAELRNLRIRDPYFPNIDIVTLGKQGSDYGLWIRNALNEPAVTVTSDGVDLFLDADLRINGESISMNKNEFIIGDEDAGIQWDKATKTLNVIGNIHMTGGSLTLEMKNELKGDKGDRGIQGLEGPQGPSGADGNDGTVPEWVDAWDIDETMITGGYICTPKIFVGQGGQLATGIKTELDGLVSYVGGIRQGFTLSTGGALDLYGEGSKVASFTFDQNGAHPDSTNRAWLKTFSGYALKIETTNANLSLSAGGTGNKVYLGSTQYTGEHDFSGANKIDWGTNAPVAVFGQ